MTELEAPAALRTFGSGWISGVSGIVLGAGSLGLVLSMLFPGIFSTKELISLQGTVAFRGVLFLMLVCAFLCSMLSLLLRQDKLLGTLGMAATLLASLFGGSHSTAVLPDYTPFYAGLDFFVLNVLFTGLIFLPLELMFPKRAEQPLFRTEWREDLFYFLVSSMLLQIFAWLSLSPAKALLESTDWSAFRNWISGLPIVIQFVAIMFLTDLVQYWVHRAFHRIRFLWFFHAVHHSAKSMDWMCHVAVSN